MYLPAVCAALEHPVKTSSLDAPQGPSSDPCCLIAFQMKAKMKASDPTDATSACPIRVHVSMRSLISSTPLGIGGGDDAADMNRSSTVDLQVFDARYKWTGSAKTLGVKKTASGRPRGAVTGDHIAAVAGKLWIRHVWHQRCLWAATSSPGTDLQPVGMNRARRAADATSLFPATPRSGPFDVAPSRIGEDQGPRICPRSGPFRQPPPETICSRVGASRCRSAARKCRSWVPPNRSAVWRLSDHLTGRLVHRTEYAPATRFDPWSRSAKARRTATSQTFPRHTTGDSWCGRYHSISPPRSPACGRTPRACSASPNGRR